MLNLNLIETFKTNPELTEMVETHQVSIEIVET